MKKAFYLETCSTCKRILGELELDSSWEMREIKSEGVSPEELDNMYDITQSYEALFSKRAMKFRSLGLNEMTLSEKDYRKYLLEEYTFLKRPVFVDGDKIFVGNAKKTVEALKQHIKG